MLEVPAPSPRKGRGPGPRAIDYLVALLRLGGKVNGRFVGTSEVAKVMGVSVPTACIMLQRLASKGLVEYVKRRGSRLTSSGLRIVAYYAWKNGVIESLLARAGVREDLRDELSREVARHVPDELVARIDEALGYPDKCPHGQPIPRPGRLGLEECGAIEECCVIGEWCPPRGAQPQHPSHGTS